MNKKIILNTANLSYACEQLWKRMCLQKLPDNYLHRKIMIAGIPRGGISAAYFLAAKRPSSFEVVDIDVADMLIDDLADSGKTRTEWGNMSNKPIAVLFSKRHEKDDAEKLPYGGKLPADQWVVFPWEGNEQASAEDIPLRLLQFIGEDATRGGLKETPARFLKAWREWTSGYQIDPKDVLKTFKDGGERIDEMIVVRDIPIYSHCEHHMAPFFGVAHIGYIPDGHIVGLSKLPRLIDVYAKRLQVQERLTAQIADAMMDHLKPRGVGIVIECRHMCMESRGICKAGTSTMTSVMRGVMLDKPEARAELLALARRRG